MVLAHAADIIGFAIVGLGLAGMRVVSALKARRQVKREAVAEAARSQS